jgi:ABC-2 type transport system ATP-binding protein
MSNDASGSAIELRGLTKRFDKVIAVSDLTLSVGAGEIFGLVGPDGAGKTTTIRMMAGIMQPDAGEITIAGCDVIKDPEAVKFQISYMPQRFGLYEDLTADENIRFYADVFRVGRREREKRSTELLRACGMEDFRQRLAGKLSGGMKQKLGLVCALIHTPKVLLLDEPTNGVDPISRREFWAMLYALAEQGVTILSSTAYLDEAERCNRVALLDRGRLLLCDTPSRLKALIPGSVVSITSPQAREVRDRLRASPGLSGLLLVGDAVHLFVDDAPRRIAEFRSDLAEAGIPYDEIHQVQPTIEDLFVRTVAGADSSTAP